MLRTTLLAIILLSTNAVADEKSNIRAMLDAFLANSHKAEQHQTFWADDLVYTSSAGKRFGKAEILSSFESEPDNARPTTTYSADEVDIRLYGDTAVLAFKLVGKQQDQPTNYYFNTGTLLKHGNQWKVVAWQATKMGKD